MAILTLALGLVVLTAGAELLVRSASRLAAAAGISSLVVGLTVVAFGTAPELVVSVHATLAGQPDVALGNVVGSNIVNVLFILGVSALIIPLRVSRQLIRIEVPLMVGVSITILIMAFDGRIGSVDGLLLTTGLISYTIWTIVRSRREQSELKPPDRTEDSRLALRAVLGSVVMLAVGLTLLVLGSRWFVDAAITIARQWGVSELVIGLTIVAAGTSLPEVATSIVAALRGERDMAVGNVVGSNLFNLLGVLGVSSIVCTDGVAVSDAAFQLDIPVMIAVSVACLPIFFTGHLIARWEGGLFLAYYGAYTAYTLLAATQTSLTRQFAVVMLAFVLPLTVIGLTISVARAVRSGPKTQE